MCITHGLRPEPQARPTRCVERTGDARVTTLSLWPLGDGHTQTHVSAHCVCFTWRRQRVVTPRPPVRQTGALPAELWRHVFLVCAAGLEPATLCSQSSCACHLRHTRVMLPRVVGDGFRRRPICAAGLRLSKRELDDRLGFGIPCGSRTRLFGLKDRGPHRKSNGTVMKTGASWRIRTSGLRFRRPALCSAELTRPCTLGCVRTRSRRACRDRCMPAPSAERAWHTCTPSWPVLVHGHTQEGINPIRKSQTKSPVPAGDRASGDRRWIPGM